MLDDFLMRALLAASGVAVVAGPLGCFVVWRRLAYFGDTLAHGSLLGVGLGLMIGIAPWWGVVAVALALALLLTRMGGARDLPHDTALGVLAHGALALGLVVLSLMPSVRVDLLSYLFGDVLAASRGDIAVIGAGAVAVLGLLVLFWRGLLASVIDEDMAAAEGTSAARMRFVMIVLLAITVAGAMKVVGVLLVTAFLILPAATARSWSRTPEIMAVSAAVVGVVAAFSGLQASLWLDTPAGPSMIVTALVMFIISRAGAGLLRA